MNITKRFAIIALSLILCLSLAGCFSSKKTSDYINDYGYDEVQDGDTVEDYINAFGDDETDVDETEAEDESVEVVDSLDSPTIVAKTISQIYNHEEANCSTGFDYGASFRFTEVSGADGYEVRVGNVVPPDDDVSYEVLSDEIPSTATDFCIQFDEAVDVVDIRAFKNTSNGTIYSDWSNCMDSFYDKATEDVECSDWGIEHDSIYQVYI